MRRICGIFKNNTSTEFKIRKLKLIKDTIIPQQNITKQYLNQELPLIKLYESYGRHG